MKALYTFALFFLFSTLAFSQLNLSYIGNITYDADLSDIWGYVAPDDTEYAIVGVFDGVSIVSLADPANPVELFFIDGAESTWRDIKTWEDHAYVTNETGDGLMVIDLSDLPNSIDSFNWEPGIPGLGTLHSAHNIYIDEYGYAYLAGSNLNGGGVLYVDVFTTPGSPVYVAAGPSEYSHDVYARDNKLYSSEINIGEFTIYEVSDKQNVQILGSQATASNFTHNTWLSDDGNVLFTTDEVGNGTVGAYDVSDPSDIQELDQFVPYETLGDGVIPHNVHVWNDFIIISYYTDGCIIVDGSNPTNLVEIANFDTFIPASTGFSGAWGAYPFLPSGLVLVSDIGNGMYVLEPNYVNACWLEGNITDANTSGPINGAHIELMTTNVSDLSNIDGTYATGYAVSGTYDVLVWHPQYESATAEAVLENGVITLLDVELVPLTPFSFAGSVIDADSGDPVPNAIVNISNFFFDYDIVTDDNGDFQFAAFYTGEYDVYGGKWGYHTSELSSTMINEGNNSLVIEIEKGYEDIFSLDLGWETELAAFSGPWERGAPIGIEIDTDLFLTPPSDVAEDLGNHCYVTGNTADLQGGVLIGGWVSLSSPSFDLTGIPNPHVSYYTWFLSVLTGNGIFPGDDVLTVTLNNGSESVVVESIDFPVFSFINWEYSDIDVDDFITPTDNMTITFSTATPFNFSSAVEAGVDYFLVFEGLPDNVTSLNETIQLNAFPNPTVDQFNVTYTVKDHLDNATLSVYNSLGQAVEQLAVTSPQGQLTLGGNLESGLYTIRLTNGNQYSQTMKVLKQ
jgi:choice-of-anchor B domain-containing protein